MRSTAEVFFLAHDHISEYHSHYKMAVKFTRIMEEKWEHIKYIDLNTLIEMVSRGVNNIFLYIKNIFKKLFFQEKRKEGRFKGVPLLCFPWGTHQLDVSSNFSSFNNLG